MCMRVYMSVFLDLFSIEENLRVCTFVCIHYVYNVCVYMCVRVSQILPPTMHVINPYCIFSCAVIKAILCEQC